MDLNQLANLGEAVGGLAVVGSLIYVAYELRVGTRTLKASKAAESSESWSSFNETVMQNDVLIDLMIRIHSEKAEWEDLTIEERGRLSLFCRSVMQRVEAEYFLYEAGIHSRDVYLNRVTNVKSWMKLPAWQGWWEREAPTSMFSTAFINTIFSEPKPARQ